VVGYASSALFDRENPLNPINRRIDILVLTKKAQHSIESAQPQAIESADTAAPAAALEEPADTVAPAAESEQPPELGEQLNIFEDGVPFDGQIESGQPLVREPVDTPD